MKRHLRIHLCAILLAAPCPAADGQDSIVRFANGDRLAGSIVSLDRDQLVWNSPVLEKPAPFFLKSVVDLTLPGGNSDLKVDHEATVTLTNGDVVHGQLATVTDQSVALDTWFAGRMEFNRLMVAGVKIDERLNLLYRGPDSMDGWTQAGEEKAWTYKRLAFVSKGSGSIAKDDLLPEECTVSFDAAWKGDSFGLKLIIFSDDVTSENPSSGYEISFQRGSIYLRNCKTQSFLGSTHSTALAEQDRVSIEVRASRKTGKICLYVNNRITEVWSDPDNARGRFGDALHFVSQNAMPLRISRIGVAPWDGVIEEMPEPRIGMMRQFGLRGAGDIPKSAPKEKPGEGRMELANGDSIEGEVASIVDGIIAMKTPLGDVKLPVARLRTVALKKVDTERCIRRNGDIRAWFADGGSIVFRLDAVSNDSLTGSSQNFGTATFKLAAFNRIEFNIYEPELEDKRSAEEW